MSQTREDRIFRHYKSLRRIRTNQDFGTRWLTLANRWRMPVRAIKDIVETKKAAS